MMIRHPNANISPAVRGRIVGLSEGGLSVDEIAEKVDVHPITVQRWITRFKVNGIDGLSDHRKNNRRPQKTTREENEQLVQMVREHPFDVVADNLGRTNLNISVRTAHRRLKEYGLNASNPAFKPALNELHRQQRLLYADEYQSWTVEDWSKVIWSDEKVFKTKKDGSKLVYRARGERLDPKFVIQNQSSGRSSVMFWGCMTSLGLMALQEVSTHMNAEEYVELLQNVMYPAAREVYPEEEHNSIYFQQDNASIHTAGIVKDWFQANPDVILIPHPPCSPDLNPIENIWGVMAKQWHSNNQLRNRNDVATHTINIWNNLRNRPDITENLVKSMPKRLENVIANRGYWTKY